MLTALLLLLLSPITAWALPQVYAGGQSIGVLLDTEGVTVVGLSPVQSGQGSQATPAADAGLQVGDLIISIDGTQVAGNEEILQLIAEAGAAGRDCRVEYVRNGLRCQTRLTPLYCDSSDSWRIGLYVQDDAAGVGTLTFWEPLSGSFGALGHRVSDASLKSGEEQAGRIVRAAVQGVRAGKAGQPGEKLGLLQEEGWQGEVSLNGSYGVYGHMVSLPVAGGGLVEVAAAEEVHEGAAQLLTVLAGEQVESFEVNIVKAGSELGLRGGMVVEVVDQELLAASGGIVQGMSGSPLLQEGRLVGAITHVFINDPTRGYACYAQQMLEEAGFSQD